MSTTYKYLKSVTTDENIHIICTDDEKVITVDISDDNPRYREIMRQVEAGELTIAPADEEE
tara:strand:- start:27 stop:209 length:183 start_codon:yes stop_codon:yes gene_type:complete